MKDFNMNTVVEKIGLNREVRNAQTNTKVNMAPVMKALNDLINTAKWYQERTPRSMDFSKLETKLKEAAAVGYQLQAKAKSGKL